MNHSNTHLVEVLSALLLEKNYSFTTAESCTGGGIAFYCTSLAGSSEWFNGSFVTYTNAMKSSVLGVESSVLSQYGAVSEQTVAQMMQGSLSCAQANIALSVSGIAGPTGATPSKPVGTVCFAVGSFNHYLTETHFFQGDRNQVREQAINTGLSLVIDYLKNEKH